MCKSVLLLFQLPLELLSFMMIERGWTLGNQVACLFTLTHPRKRRLYRFDENNINFGRERERERIHLKDRYLLELLIFGMADSFDDCQAITALCSSVPGGLNL